MGLLDGLAGQLVSQIGGGTKAASVIPVVLQMLQGGQGGPSGQGLAGLAQQFTQKGLGDIMSSWIGTGQNLPISGSQLQQVLGSDMISQMAGKAGLSSEDMTSQLSVLLPQVVDKLTPNGKLPEGNDLAGVAGNLLKGMF